MGELAELLGELAELLGELAELPGISPRAQACMGPGKKPRPGSSAWGLGHWALTLGPVPGSDIKIWRVKYGESSKKISKIEFGPWARARAIGTGPGL